MACLCLLTIGIGQLADEMGLISSFLPCFRDIRSNGPRRPTNLVRKRESFFSRKGPTHPKYLLLQHERFLIHIQVFKAHQPLCHSSSPPPDFFKPYRTYSRPSSAFRLLSSRGRKSALTRPLLRFRQIQTCYHFGELFVGNPFRVVVTPAVEALWTQFAAAIGVP